MPRPGQFARRSTNGSNGTGPGNWAGNTSLWNSLQADDQRSRANDDREQAMQFREEHMQKMDEIAQSAAKLHDMQVTSTLAEHDALLKRQQDKEAATTSAYKALSSLDTKSPDFRVKFAQVGAQYPSAFDNSDKQTEGGIAKFSADMLQEHSKWQEANQAQAIERQKYIGQLEASTGVPMVYNADGSPNFAAHGKSAMQNVAAQAAAGGLVVKSAGMSAQGHQEVQYGDPKTVMTPMQQAQRIQAEINSHQTGIAQAGTQLEKIQKDNPWLADTTGIYKDPNTNIEYFGNSKPSDTTANMQIATPAAKSLFAQQQALMADQQAKMSNLPKLQERLTGILAGGDTAPVTASLVAPTSATSPHDAALQWATANPDDPRATAIRAAASAATQSTPPVPQDQL